MMKFFENRIRLNFFFQLAKLSLITAIIAIWIFLFISIAFPDNQGIDFYPLYIGAKALILGQDPYGEASQAMLKNIWTTNGAKVAHIVAYPAPFLLAVSPLTILQLPIAVIVWTVLCFASVIISFTWVKKSKIGYLLPFLYYPFFHALYLKNASILVLGISYLLISGSLDKLPHLKGFLASFCICKPQAGIFYAFYSYTQKIKASGVIWLTACLSFLTATAFVLFPGWFWAWVQAIQIYANEAATINLFPWNILLCIAVIKAPTLVQISLFQTLLFPINDLYCALPLLIGWTAFSPVVSIIGTSISLLIPILYEAPNNTETFLYFCVLPYVFVCVLSQIGRLPCFSALTLWSK